MLVLDRYGMQHFSVHNKIRSTAWSEFVAEVSSARLRSTKIGITKPKKKSIGLGPMW